MAECGGFEAGRAEGTMRASALGILVLVVAWTAYAFNRLVRQSNLVREAWSGIDVQLKRRHDLVPNLVEVVKAYAAHEREIFESVARLRSEAAAARASAELERHENTLASRLRSVLAVAEAYPELLANRSFLDLQNQLAEVENHLQMARRYYNGTVRDYNVAVESFPSNVVAAALGFRLERYFQVESAIERQVPKVEV